MSITQHKTCNNTPAGGNPACDPRIAFFDGHAEDWDRTGPDPVQTLERVRSLDGQLGLRPGIDALEIGCGTGQLSGWLASRIRPGRLVSADFSSAMLDKARQRGLEVEFRLLDICDEGQPIGSFDFILCFHSFPHFRDPQAALRQIARSLKPCGHFVVLHLAGSLQLNAFHHRVGGAVGMDHLPPGPAWDSMMKGVGLRLLEATDREDLFLVRAQRDGES